MNAPLFTGSSRAAASARESKMYKRKKGRKKKKERREFVLFSLTHSLQLCETGSIFNCSLRLDLLVIFINTQLAGGKMGRADGDVNTVRIFGWNVARGRCYIFY